VLVPREGDNLFDVGRHEHLRSEPTRIGHDPANYHVNIQSTVFPAGAARGQLGK
jgi:hypothetical protein